MLLSVCLFNLAGYTLLFDYFEAKNEMSMVEQLDLQHYKDEDLIEIRLPFQVPYLVDWADFRREDGEIEIDGRHYSYVKIKFSQDTIYLKCLPNNSKDELVAARKQAIKQLNDLPAEDEGAPSLMKKAQHLFGFNQHILSYPIESPEQPVVREYNLFQSAAADGFRGECLHPPAA